MATSSSQSLSGKKIATDINTTKVFSSDSRLLIPSSVTTNPSLHYSANNDPTQQFSVNNLLLQSTTSNPAVQYSTTDNPSQQLSTKNTLVYSSTYNNPSIQPSYGTAIINKTDNLKSSEHHDLQTSSQLQIYAVWGYGLPWWGMGYGIPLRGYGVPRWGYGRTGWGYGRPGWGYSRPGWWYGRHRW